ncbi:hypothetical protein ACP70R_015089 [Stipagrostis hirtigluma subsp. patula]
MQFNSMAPRTDGAVVRAFTWLLVASGFLFLGTVTALMDVDRRRLDQEMSMFPPGMAIAIDMGNTNACVAGYNRGGSGTMFHLCIPSWVAFADDGAVLVGEDAKNHAAVDPQAAIFGFKRLLGRRFNSVYDQEFVRRVAENMPYKVVDKDMRPHVEVKTKDGVVRHLGMEQLTTMVFAKLKEMAEAHHGRRVHAAFFTVPGHYVNIAPRHAVLYGSTYADLHTMRVLDEPIAAAIAYGLHEKLRDEGNVLVLHIGGGTAEASVLTFVDGVFEFLGGDLDFFFGGDDFDQRIVDYFVELIQEKNGRDISNDNAALRKLRTACEHAKKTLSNQDHTQVNIESIVDGVDLSETLTRAKFEELCHDLFLKVIEMVDRVMLLAELEKNKNLVDEIVLIGGSTMIPKIRELVTDYFDGKELNTKLKPDESVALGAALLSHPTANGYPCMGVNNRRQIGGPSDICYTYEYY